MNQKPITAVLLAAGRGKRLRPHTDFMPKSLLPVNGRAALDHILTAVAEADIRNVCIVTHHMSEQIEKFVGDGSAWNLTATYCRQPSLVGTAHALQTAVSFYPALFARERPFILTATDYFLMSDYLVNLVTAHLDNGTDMTISLKKLPSEEIIASSSVQFQQDGHIGRIVEKPSPEDITGPLSASLTFVLPGAIRDYFPHMKPSPRGEFEIQSVINQMLQDGLTASGLVQAAPHEWNEASGSTMTM
jgi:NDP-sugar pyrophosphorylase family protein